MDWFYFTVFSGIAWGVLSVVAKDVMEDTAATVYTALYSLLALAFYTPYFMYFVSQNSISYSDAAVIALGFSMLANLVAFLAYNYSIEEGQLSKVIPFTRLTPLFAALFGAAILGESIDLSLGAGIIAATVGGVVLLKEDHIDYLTSVEDGLHQQAIQAAVLSALFYGAASVADRFATQIIQPEVYTFFIYLALTTALITVVFSRFEDGRVQIASSFREYRNLYIFTGFLAALATLSIFHAFSRAPASMVTPVLQVQVMIPVIAGVLFFGEEKLLRKIVGSVILIAGVALVVI